MTFHLNSVRNMSGGFFVIGERVICSINGRKAIINDTSQGDSDYAFISYTDGTHDNVKWNDLTRITMPPTMPKGVEE